MERPETALVRALSANAHARGGVKAFDDDDEVTLLNDSSGSRHRRRVFGRRRRRVRVDVKHRSESVGHDALGYVRVR